MIKIHHLNDSRSQRILWFLEELKCAYEIIPYARDEVTRLAPPSLKAVHPLGKSPVLEDNGLIIAESGAIIEYLARRYGAGGFIPDDQSPKFIHHLHWLHFAEGSAMLPFLLALYVGRLGAAGAPLHPRIESEIDNHLSYMDNALKDSDYFLGNEIMAVDFQMSFVVEIANTQGKLKSYARLQAYLARLQARPAYKKALERGGPYRFA